MATKPSKLQIIVEVITGAAQGDLKKTEGAVKKLTDSLTPLEKGLAAAAIGGATLKIALNKAFELGEQVYALGRMGAELELTESKFNNLAASIGTTSEALNNDLQRAFNGTISNAQGMAMVGDLISLGLAKSHDEAVRLASVAGKLGMDMNQLVLTLTNQTTMRFDSLGLAVDGFDEKVKQLEQTGLSTSDAFKEAFLQQAEAQILLVGDATETTLGDFQRMEASIADLSDAFKQKLAPAVADAAAGLLKFVDAQKYYLNQGAEETGKTLRDNSASWAEYVEGIVAATEEAQGRQFEAVQRQKMIADLISGETTFDEAYYLQVNRALMDGLDIMEQYEFGAYRVSKAIKDAGKEAGYVEFAPIIEMEPVDLFTTAELISQIELFKSTAQMPVKDPFGGFIDAAGSATNEVIDFTNGMAEAQMIAASDINFAVFQNAKRDAQAAKQAIEDTVTAFDGINMSLSSSLLGDVGKADRLIETGGIFESLAESARKAFEDTGDVEAYRDALTEIISLETDFQYEARNIGYGEAATNLANLGLSLEEIGEILNNTTGTDSILGQANELSMDYTDVAETGTEIDGVKTDVMWLEDNVHVVTFRADMVGNWPTGASYTTGSSAGSGGPPDKTSSPSTYPGRGLDATLATLPADIAMAVRDAVQQAMV